MGNLKKISTVLFLFVFMAALIFAGTPSRKITVKNDPTGKPSLLKPYVEGEVLVKFKKGVSFDAVNQIAVQNTMAVKKHFRTLSKLKGNEYVLLRSSRANTLDMVNELKKNVSVEAVTPNYRNEIAATPNDTRYSELWGMHNTGQTGGTADADIDAPEAWNITTGSTNNIVAVIDTGLDYLHPDLAANVWVNAAEFSGTAGVDDDGNGYIDDIYGIDPAGTDGLTPDTDPMDGYGHGTHCSGTIGAVGNNSLGVVGVNWNVKIMGLKFFDDAGGNGYDSFAIECIDYILDQKVNRGQNIVAINASWGSTYFDQVLKDAIDIAGQAAGIVFCAATGNGGSDDIGDDNDTTPHYPSSYDSTNIIAVAATDDADVIADFSNYGATSADLGAPGVGILSTVPGTYVPQTGDIFFDDMESGVGNWVHGGTLDTWAISENQEIFANPSFPVPSPTHFWSDSPGVKYSANTDSWLAYGVDIDLSSYVGQDVYLGIGSAMYIEGDDYDHGYVELSNDSGATWTPIFDFGGYAYYWSRYSWLIPNDFKTSHFRFRFHLTSDDSYQYYGFLIDNVGIGTAKIYGYESWDGTSMATPHVTGAVALMASQFPTESMADRINRILMAVDPNASLAGLCTTEGRLNLFNALNYVPAAATITVTSPNGGETLLVGASHDITWNATGTVGDINIDYSTGTTWHTVVSGTANDGSYTWTVPNTPSNICLVRVSETVDGNPLDTSDAAFTIAVQVVETVSAPNTPTGPATGIITNSYVFSSGGSISSMGHAVQYKFDWDDGSDSGWLAQETTSASHTWTANGTYDVRAMARCVSDTGVESLWSATHTFIISDAGTLYYNSPAQRKILPEVIWAAATGGGIWMSEVQVTDISGGSQVSVYYNTAAGRRGPFLLWNNSGGGPLNSMKYSNMLQTIDGLDSGTFTYDGTVGAVEFVSQDAAHVLQVTARMLNGNYSKTIPGLSLHDSNTADTGRVMTVANLTNNGTYRSTCGLFNPTADAVTVELRLYDSVNTQIGTTITKTLNGYGFTAFSPFNDAGVAYPANSFDNVILQIQPTSGTGKVLCFGASANNATNDPAAHIAVQNGSSFDNGPSSLKILPEAIWAAATGGGTWMSETQIVDVTGGSAVSVYFDYGAGSRRGPFLFWTGGVAGSKVKCANILQQIETLDSGFTYSGRVGTVEFQTQDGTHFIQVTARTLNGDYSKTFPGLNLVDAETADKGRMMLIQNYSSNSTYRSSCGFFNPTGDFVTVEFTLLDGGGTPIGSQFSKTFVGYDFQAFNPFNEAGVLYPANSFDNVILRVRPTTGSGKVVCFGASANNASNDPAAHLAVQVQ